LSITLLPFLGLALPGWFGLGYCPANPSTTIYIAQ
jgi:hypothetical protein